jgi:hypothetical protein
VVVPTWSAYCGWMAAVLHPTDLPFTADQLKAHFAPVLADGELDRHLRYYRASTEQAKLHADRMSGGIKPTPAQAQLGRQMEKDERFWVATALMSLYHEDGASREVSCSAACSTRGACALQLHLPGGSRRFPVS